MYRAPTRWKMSGESSFHRRSIRIPGADYTEPRAYFLTICSDDRRNIFGNVEHGRVILSRLGELVRDCWVRIPEHSKNAAIEEFIVMPNHLHGIVRLSVGARYIVPSDRGAGETEGFQAPVRGSIPTIVRTYKAAATRLAREALGVASAAVWQKNYFERVVRDADAATCRYIADNPMQWEWDDENLAHHRVPGNGDSILSKT